MPLPHAGFYGADNLVTAGGVVLDSGTAIDVYEPGTTTHAQLWTDRDRTAAGPNPVPLDQWGNLSFYAEAGPYDIDAGAGPARVVAQPDAEDIAPGVSALQASDIGVTVQAWAAVLDATSAAFTAAQQAKLAGIAPGAEVNVNADWNAGSGDAAILNKPALGTAAAQNVGAFATAAQGAKADTAVQPGALAPVATSGAYADLSGAPSIPNTPGDIGAATAAQGALADTAVQPGDLGTAATADATDFATAAQGSTADTAVQPGDLAAVATTGAYGDLSGTPTLGTAAAEDTTAFATAAQGSLADSATQPGDLAAVATTGAYADLSGTPTLGTAAAEDVGDFASAAQGSTADSALQPTDLSGTGLVTYTSGTGVIDVDEDDVTDLAEAVVDALPELTDSLSNVITSPSAGLLTIEQRVLLLSTGQVANTTTETSVTSPLTVIPGGTISLGSDLLTLDASGTIEQQAGADRTLTIRVKRVLDPTGTPTRVTGWTFTAVIPSAAGTRAWTLVLPMRVIDIGFGPIVIGTAQLRIFTATGPIAFDLGTQVAAIASLPDGDPWAVEITAQWSGTGATTIFNHLFGVLRSERT